MPNEYKTSKQSTECYDAKELTPAQKFFISAKYSSGVFISTCGDESSGCHAFTRTITAQFSNLDYVGMTRCCQDPVCDKPAKIFSSTTKEKKAWKAVFISGCKINVSQKILNALKRDHQTDHLEQVFIVYTAHQSDSVLEHYYTRQNIYELNFSSTPYEIISVTSGIDIKHPHAIGLPNPIHDFPEAKTTTPENCYGMMYHGKTIFHHENVQEYLQAYFSQVAMRAKNSSTQPILVIAINFHPKVQTLVTLIASQFNIEVQHVKKLPADEFKQTLQLIAAKKGLISLDGTQTVKEAILTKTPFMVYYHSQVNHNNTAFYQQIIRFVPANLKEFAKAIFSQTNKYALLKDTERCSFVYDEIYSIFKIGVDDFATKKEKTPRVITNTTSNHVILKFLACSAKVEIYLDSLAPLVGQDRRGKPIIKLTTEGAVKTATFSRFWLKAVAANNPQGIDELACELDVPKAKFGTTS